MKLFIDLQGAQTPGSRVRGIGRYSRDLAAALTRGAPASSSIFLGWNKLLENPVTELNLTNSLNQNVEVTSYPYGALARSNYQFARHDTHQEINDRLLRYAVARSQCDHILFTSLIENDEVNFVQPLNLNFAPTTTSFSIIYDIIPYIFKENYLNNDNLLNNYLSQISLALSADIIFTISSKTKEDLLDRFNVDSSRVIVIGTGIDPEQFGHQASDSAPGLDSEERLGKPYLLFLGGDEFRKNLTGFANAFCQLPYWVRGNLQALIVGKVSKNARQLVYELLQKHGIEPDAMQFAEHLSQPTLVQAYRQCALVVIPSLYEGFGLPALEAMACGSAIVASKNSGLSDIVLDPDFLFDATDTQDIASKIEFALTNSSRTDKLKATYPDILKQHTWSSVANRVFGALHGIQLIKKSLNFNLLQPALDIVVVLTSSPSHEAVDRITDISKSHKVKVYYKTLCTKISALPVHIEHVSGIWKHALAKTPAFHFASDTLELEWMEQNYPVFNIIAILMNGNQGRSNSRANLSYYSVWPAYPHEHLLAIQSACWSYKVGSPFNLAADLKATLKNSGMPHKYSNELSEAASVAYFESKPLVPPDPRQALSAKKPGSPLAAS